MTDDRAALKEQLEAATGERIAALEAVEPERAKGREAGLEASSGRGGEREIAGSRQRDDGPGMEPARAPKGLDRDLGL